ncbi:MAG: GreA/GreB family elongation factor [Candidatus Cloacimonetes bacterium]|nr:GreA/GreB family elongation factor [Candidatus Cloacimonadota bacterium]
MNEKELEKTNNLLDYLLELTKLRSRVIGDIRQYPEHIWLNDFSGIKGCKSILELQDEQTAQEEWFEVKKYGQPELRPLPESCIPWIDEEDLTDIENVPELKEEIDFEDQINVFLDLKKDEEAEPSLLIDYPGVKKDWEEYLRNKWIPWAESQREWLKNNQLYKKLFMIYQEQKKSEEEYELVIGFGLLNWQSATGRKIRRHLITFKANLEFISEEGKFIIKESPEGLDLRAETEMIANDYQGRLDLKEIDDELSNLDDLFDLAKLSRIIKKEINELSPDSEFSDSLTPEEEGFKQNIYVELSPALILRKRSVRGLIESIIEIKKQLQEGEVSITTGFRKIIDCYNKEDYAVDENDSGGEKPEEDEQIYFPKFSNDEQRLILDRLRKSDGVLVQGPPGTGKSHTIANLISHYLALGKRILVTAKTPRALKVLIGLIPEELRHLCISILGSGSEEQEKLRDSVDKILETNNNWSDIDNGTKIELLRDKYEELCAELADKNNRLMEIRELETAKKHIINGQYSGSLTQIAIEIRHDIDEREWFTDEVKYGNDYPFAEYDMLAILHEIRRFDEEKKGELNQEWINPEETVEEFSDLVKEEMEIAEKLKEEAEAKDEEICERLTGITLENVEIIKESVNELQQNINSPYLKSEDWIRRAIRDVQIKNPQYWSHIAWRSEIILEEVNESLYDILHLKVELNDKSIVYVLEDAKELSSYFDGGGRKGFFIFRNKIVRKNKYILDSIYINGHNCDDSKKLHQLISWLQVKKSFADLKNLWGDNISIDGEDLELQFLSYQESTKKLNKALSLQQYMQNIDAIARENGVDLSNYYIDTESLSLFHNSIEYQITKLELERIKDKFTAMRSQVASYSHNGKHHKVCDDIVMSIDRRDSFEYGKAKSIVEELTLERERLDELIEKIMFIKLSIPLLLDSIEADRDNGVWDSRLADLEKTWQCYQARDWLKDYISRDNLYAVISRIKQIEEEKNKVLSELIALMAWQHCIINLKNNENIAKNMVAWQQIIKKIGKGTGKYAVKQRRIARSYLQNCKDGVPAWVMPLHRVWDTIKPEPGMFDVIIIDEASQCGFESYPLFYIAKKIVIVGDDQQISPEAVGISPVQVEPLQNQYLSDFEFIDSFDIDKSLFDLGALQFFGDRVILREHFRCMPEIIKFSNDTCYNSTPLVPLRQYTSERLDPLKHTLVRDGFVEGSKSNLINRAEAVELVKTVVMMCNDERYDDKTIGIISLLGHSQSRYIEKLLIEEVEIETIQARNILCGEPYSFQGDQRDVILLSLVSATNARIGVLSKESDKRRFNVAASRAKDQMWLFHSVELYDLSQSCFRYKLLQYFLNPGEVKFSGIGLEELKRIRITSDRATNRPPGRFDSWFEVDVAYEIVARGYTVIPQYEVAGKRIDLVIQSGASQLAVECDGDAFHGIENYARDHARQRMLERCGWEFYRIRGSEFYIDREEALRKLWEILSDRGIYPVTEESATEGDGEELQQEDSQSEDSNLPEDIVEVGDNVTYSLIDDDKLFCSQITLNASDKDLGLINIDTPLGKGLLHKKTGQEVEIILPKGKKIFVIKEIEKASAGESEGDGVIEDVN